ncbi:MAG: hypothetical protein M3Q73_03290 [bacterium]|nr:hypothetical protein [bacterium]
MSKIELFSRISLFIIYFWFGILKVFDLSPATPLVEALQKQTLPAFITPSGFLIAFGIFECILGILFLMPRLTKLSKWLFAAHMITTFMPLLTLPAAVWVKRFVPTLEGQYIIKNLALIATVFHLKK